LRWVAVDLCTSADNGRGPYENAATLTFGVTHVTRSASAFAA
jgi:hypothetical protein